MLPHLQPVPLRKQRTRVDYHDPHQVVSGLSLGYPLDHDDEGWDDPGVSVNGSQWMWRLDGVEEESNGGYRILVDPATKVHQSQVVNRPEKLSAFTLVRKA